MTEQSATPALFPARETAAELTELRRRVQTFVNEWRSEGRFAPRCDAWLRGHDLNFSRALAERGWIGMSWPHDVGGGGRSNVARMVVTEELLRAGAPVAAHWMADRQIGPAILRHGSAELQKRFLPPIARAEITFCVGLSETESGSDLASVRTVAEPADDGWRIRGHKVWTSHAHRSSHAYVLARTGRDGSKYDGLTEFIVDMGADGVTVRPIHDLNGEHHFNEVTFDDVFVPAENVLGTVGNGWQQVTEQLAFERGGMERVLSTYPLLKSILSARTAQTPRLSRQIGETLATASTLRRMALRIAAGMDAGEAPTHDAAVLKDLGTSFESSVNDLARAVLDIEPDPLAPGDAGLLADGVLAAPGFTIRGGSTQVLRTIVSKNVIRTSTPGDRQSAALSSVADDILDGYRSELVGEPGSLPPVWSRVTELGWTGVGTPEDLGGSGGDLTDLAVLIEACGRNTVSMPLAETTWACRVLTEAGLVPPQGAATVVLPSRGDHAIVANETLSGTVTRVPWGCAAEHVVVFAADADGPNSLLCIPADATGVEWEPGRNLAGEPRDTVHFNGVRITRDHQVALVPARMNASALGALLRAVSIVGALQTALDHTVRHVNTREQFGHPLRAFQAVSTLVAGMAAQLALARTAVWAAVTASEHKVDIERVAAAMVVAGKAATEVSRDAHQLHGAMGVTREHPLQLATRRLWSWRDECGGDTYWARLLAERLLRLGEDGIWQWLTADHDEWQGNS